MTNNELITELLKYDGFTKDIGNHSITYTSEIDSEGYRTVIGNEYAQTYLTDMNIIHRIAVKVTAQLKEMYSDDSHDTSFDFEHDMKVTEVKGTVISSIFTSPNSQGEHIQLATAIVNAIRYISGNKER